jgi:hypothetical protein
MIETPEEFAIKLGYISSNCDRMAVSDEERKAYLKEAVIEVTARDAAIRKECAEKAVRWLNDDTVGCSNDSLRAAIVGKEGEE